MTWSRCPGDLHFNEVTRTCDHPCRAGCKDRREIGACCPADGEVYEDPCTCDMYYLCTNGIKELVKCEDGLQYNNTLGRCDNSCSGGCPKLFAGNPECCASTSGKPEPQCPATTYPIFLPHPSSSQFFYKCVNGVRSCIRCPLQRRWNTDTDTCDETACSRPETPFY
ncbi:putative chitinase 3 [Zootermopsis nevadensis]|uniref:Putative chitinase 3 n=2 Tax=Zootermopsis nevadensis TaxID=136037 RepID=A0A067QZJ9_ZOONE|nr:putative chitinase 3 [Zootermopsis nevadensis]